MKKKFDPIEIEVFKNLFLSITDEMGVTLCRTAYSPNIKERRDYSCALFDGDGQAAAMGDHMPVHLGSMPDSVACCIKKMDFSPGDIAIVNDPFEGGTHLPDITLVAPLFIGKTKRPNFLIGNRAHHSDIGGMSVGSMPLATEIYQEGLIIPPTKLFIKGVLNKDLMDVILSNVRTPKEREGDLSAQVASINTGIKRLLAAIDKYGLKKIEQMMKELQAYTEVITRGALRGLPNGEYCFADKLDNDGIKDVPIKIRVKIKISGDRATVDFTGTDPQVEGSVNANMAITKSAVFYCFRSILGPDAPANSGTFKPLKIIAPQGSVINANRPAAVAGGNVETSQRIVDTLIGALAKADPKIVCAASSGTMNNITIGGIDPNTGEPFAYYETIGGGMGANHDGEGLDGVHTNMSNSLNTPIEALENFYPFKIRSYKYRKGSGGKGKRRGGDGIIREYEFLSTCDFTILSERRTFGPYGLKGGNAGSPGINILISKGKKTTLPSKISLKIKKGDIIRIESPGGGGFGM